MVEAGELRMGTPAGRWVLLTTVLGSGIVMIDGTVVNVALERIGTELDADFASLQWTVNAYTLTLASLILLGGSLGDHLGRRRVFLIGVVWFALASLACGLAPGAEARMLTIRSQLGYTGSDQTREDMLKNSHFVDAEVELFAKYASEQWKRVGEYVISRRLITK